MKSTSKMMVIAAVFLVAAALLVAPGAARNLTNGDTFFAEENGAELTLDFPEEVGTINRVVRIKDNDFDAPEEINDFKVVDGKITTNLQGADFKDSYFGTYFVDNGTLQKGYKLYFEKPTLKVDVVLANDKSSSVAGKTVTKDNQVFFKVDTGKVGSTHNANVPANYFNLKVELKGEDDGSTITVIPHDGYDQDLKDVDVTQQLLYVGNSTDYDGTDSADGIYLKDLTAQTYAVKAVWTEPLGFDQYAADSTEATFTVSTVDLSIEANKENVVRNNDFSVTVTGNSKTPYFLYIKDASVADNLYPMIKAGQPSVDVLGINENFTDDLKNVNGDDPASAKLADRERATNGTHYPANTAAVIKTNAGGQRTIGFNTYTYTDDKSYTIKVVNPDDSSKYDDIKVKIEEGEVTITAEGSGTYYLGEEIKLSGTNTDNDKVFLFMTGPNLGDENGVSLVNLDAYASNGDYLEREVEGDDTWEYRWDTSAITGGILDAGAYNVYAASRGVADNGLAVTKNNLKGVKYATFNVRLDQPFLTLDDVASTVAQGDDLTVSGVAEGKPDNVRIWIFGKNYRNLGESESVEDDGTFEFEFENTESLATGQYFLVVQHPMTDREFNVRPAPEKGTYVIRDATGSFVNLGKLSASEAANALVDALNSPYCDDTYRKVSFDVAAAVIAIEPVGDQSIGTKFTISGTTNLAVGDDLQVEVSGASFGPAKKTEGTGFASSTGTVTVEKGDGINTWSYEVDASDFKPDQYTVTVESIDADVTASSTFNMIEGPVSPVETETTPSVTTTAPADVTTTAPETTAPPTPGFGALVALVGLGAVAFLVMRRN
ncbi:PGF-CTERM protein [Methanofollis sp. W23]|uniref:MEMAR_RS02690 family S-layer glycoprotein n=1 Tax=Methanofollis sp. W23 TaxID=2817849 RepID=UPI001AE658AA|nr:MEMAR_RS02690 family S-layer glycoprotein [Methanofollis sp. W23]MBP2146568.1 PGF-CTERM protein [Methanofollis sp. W23]